jgi:5-formyltetrahydrofolate cyclo-ligase
MPADSAIAADKAALRRHMAAIRDASHAQADPSAAIPRLLDALGAADPVAAYWPMRNEADPRPALHALHAAGRTLCLPVVVARGAPLAFRRWTPDMAMVPGGFGVLVPALDVPVRPAALIVPMLAFDRTGFRLGYGGGFYDRTLAALREAGPVLAVGLAFAAQAVESVPRTVDDQRLDIIVTERETIRPEGFA